MPGGDRTGGRQALRLGVAVFALLLAVCSGIALAADRGGQAEEVSSQGGLAPRELKGERTATSRTFSLADGSREARVFEVPINYRDEKGDWKPIDAGLEELPAGGVANGENSFELRLPERLSDGVVRVSAGEQWISQRLLGADTVPVELEGETAVYEDPAAAATFELTSLPTGLKEDIVLADASAPSAYRYELDASAGLTPVLTEAGAIEVRDAEGKAFATLPAPFVTDSADSPVTSFGAVEYALEQRAQGVWLLTVAVDGAWLDDPARAWPVRIDPTVVVARPNGFTSSGALQRECGIDSTSTGRICATSTSVPSLPVAFNPASKRTRRSLVRFDLAGIPAGAHVIDATLSLHAAAAAQNTLGIEVRRITTLWTDLFVTWTNSISSFTKWTTPGGDFNAEGAEVLTSARGSQAGSWDFNSAGLTDLVKGWVAGSIPNQGFLVKQTNESNAECAADSTKCAERLVSFNTNFASSPANSAPALRVTFFPKAPASSRLTSPAEGTTTARRLKLQAKWTVAGVANVTYQYREGKTGPFKLIPSELVRDADGKAITWPLPVKGQNLHVDPVYFNAAHVSPFLAEVGGPIQVRAIFGGEVTGVEGYSAPVEAKVDRFLGGPRDATADVGPGTLDLLTGNYSVSESDVAISGFSPLEFGRTHNSRDPGKATDTGILGPGWKPSLSLEEAGGAGWQVAKNVNVTETIEGESVTFTYVEVLGPEGTAIPFDFDPASGQYITPPELTGWSLRSVSEGTQLVLSEPSGNSTTFQKSTLNPNEFVPIAVSQSSGNRTQFVYIIEGSTRRLSMVIAPRANGGDCPANDEALTREGCRVLRFNYLADISVGGAGMRLGSVALYAPGNGGPWSVAAYNYDSEGRLSEFWDPRISPPLKTKYTYAPGGQLETITPPGQEPWGLEYETGFFDGELDNGRLIAVKRASLLASSPVAQTTIVYGVPISGSGAPYEMSGGDVADWGQKDIPVDATAVFPPDQVPTSEPPESYSRATVYYMDAEGYAVNTAAPAGAGAEAASISTSETDEFGNVVRELTPQNRLRALAEEDGSDPVSEWFYTQRRYTADGTEMLEEWGPLHETRVQEGAKAGETIEARFHKVVQYDEGYVAESGRPQPHLPTRETTNALAKSGEVFDNRVTEYRYSWKLRQQTEMIVDPGGLNIRSVTVYNESTGLPTEIRQPSEPGGGGAGTTRFVYYHSGPLPQQVCRQPKWEGLPCEISPAAQPGTAGQPQLPVKRFASYNALAQPLFVEESPGGGTANMRNTSTSYDEAGRQLREITVGGGTVVPKTEIVYSPRTGAPIKQRFVCESNCTPTPTFVSTLGSSGSGDGQFSHPAGSAVDEHGRFWVVDRDNNRVQKFNSRGDFLFKFGSVGSGNGQLSSPADIAIDLAGNLLVLDSGNGRVQKFSPQGEFLAQFGSPGSANGQLSGAHGIAVDPRGNIWVADTGNHRVQKFNAKGQFLMRVDFLGSPAGQLEEPEDLDVDARGRVWIVDAKKHSVIVVDENGGLLKQLGSVGHGQGDFFFPATIEIDPDGYLWVGQQLSARFQRFAIQEGSPALTFVGEFFVPAGVEKFLQVPMGMAVDGDGNVWISDSLHDQVHRWKGAYVDRQTTTTNYDALGRVVSYVDADGNEATRTYDLLGRPVTANDGKGTVTMTYDPTSGLPVKMEDSAAGTFTAAYDADGNLTARGLPNGLVAETTYDETGTPTDLTYNKATNCSIDCEWLSFSAEESIHGQVLKQTSTLSEQQYGYDKLGRLTVVRDRDEPGGGACTTREYLFENFPSEGKFPGRNSNRTKKITRSPGIGGVCDTTSGGTTQSYSYDSADRLIGGPVYDSWGRITNLPGSVAGGGTLTTSYFSTDMVASQTQDGITNSYQLDASLRQRERIQVGGGLQGPEIFHYAGPSDSPNWTEQGASWSRNIIGFGGGLAAIQDSAKGVSLQLTNLHGDVTATASLDPSATGPTATHEFDEFGNPKQGSPPRFGWVGEKARRTELPSGVIQMGVRSYVPALGRFLTPDPILGGSANAYDYAYQDPVNNFDLTGEKCASKKPAAIERCKQMKEEAARARRLSGRGKKTIVLMLNRKHGASASFDPWKKLENAADSILNTLEGGVKTVKKKAGAITITLSGPAYKAAGEAFKLANKWGPDRVVQYWGCGKWIAGGSGDCDPFEMWWGETTDTAR